ncbi:hypothetical protein AWC38_SpisGene13715 [Stylophora pistillata]|uniref:Endonuclease/exonuclease/phosphatase domain-containing protein n=1 Tax=Stylophora pistillata TaxID=50429 RepID=A0A2B4RZP7_STYPI|nr:hypothetical protein AWC38_SpisGene13715 [Stylophora pistillata]
MHTPRSSHLISSSWLSLEISTKKMTLSEMLVGRRFAPNYNTQEREENVWNQGSHFVSLAIHRIQTKPCRRFFCERIARYASSSSSSTFQLLKKSAVRRILLSGDIELNPGPLDSSAVNQERDLFSLLSSLKNNSYCGASIGHLNVRGLHSKLNEIKFLLNHSSLDILAITETHLNCTIDDTELLIDGYFIKRNDRQDGRDGGEVALYYKSHLHLEVVPKYMQNSLEVLWMELIISSRRLLIGCAYRPPDYNNFYDDLKPILERIWLTRKNVIVTGDLNSNILKKDCNGKKILQILRAFNYKNLNKSPTRVKETTSTLLDVVIVSDYSKAHSSGVIDFAIADHKFIFVVYELKKQKAKPKTVYSQSFKNVD